jgi:thioredoxin reductase
MVLDAIIVGAGPAGLSAALLLGRCRRSVAVFNSGARRNASSAAIHALLANDGTPPDSFIAAGLSNIARYPSVRLRNEEVIGIEAGPDGFRVRTEAWAGTAKKVLLATGLADDLPDLPRATEFYGKSIHHCLYCDGFEYADQPIAIYGPGDRGAALALMASHWTREVTLCTHGGDEPSAVMLERLAARQIRICTEPIGSLEGTGGALDCVVLAGGEKLHCRAIFFATGCRQRSGLSELLGCKRDSKGGIITDPLTEETSVPGVYVAGDASRDVLLVSIAVAEGAKAAVAINRALLVAEGLLEA